MIFNDKRGNLHNIERFESLAFCHSSSAGRRFDAHIQGYASGSLNKPMPADQYMHFPHASALWFAPVPSTLSHPARLSCPSRFTHPVASPCNAP